MTTKRICKKFQSGAYVDKFGYQEETLCSKLKSGFSDRRNSAFELKRPSFKSGEIIHNIQAQSIDNINKRSNTGNRQIVRPNFEASKIRPRELIDFDKLQALDLETQGAKIQLSEKTIDEMFKVKIPDNLDITWLAEKERLINVYKAKGMSATEIERELQVNKPLGREQRTITSKENIAQSSLSIGAKLNELQQEVKDGRVESQGQQRILLEQFTLVLSDTNGISKLTNIQLSDLGLSLAKIGAPTNYKALSLPRIVDTKFYSANAGKINLLLFSKVREIQNNENYNYEKICKNFARSPNGFPGITLTEMISGLNKRGKHRLYLDLDKGGIISKRQLEKDLSDDDIVEMFEGIKIGDEKSSDDISVDPAYR